MMANATLPGALGATLALLLSAAPAGAEDYPYSGFFNSQTVDVAAEDAQLACAYNFFQQNADGTFVNYVIDKKAYDSDGTVRFSQYGAGKCVITGGRVETCTMSASVEPGEIGRAYYDVLKSIHPDAIDNASFETDQEANLYALAGLGAAGALELRFSLCHGFSDERMKPLLSPEMTSLSADERNPLISPEFNDTTRAEMLAILRKIGTRQ